MHKTAATRFYIATTLIVVASILYCSWPLGFWLNPVASRAGLASELGAWGQPYNWLFIGADIVSGIFLVIGCVLLAQVFQVRGWRKISLVCLAVYGICGAIDASLPLRCLPSVQVCGSVWHDPSMILHGVVDIIGSLTLIGTLVAEWLYNRAKHRDWLQWIYIIGGGGVLFALLSGIFLITNGPGYWAQRYYITLSCLWVASIPFMYYSQQQPASKRRT